MIFIVDVQLVNANGCAKNDITDYQIVIKFYFTKLVRYRTLLFGNGTKELEWELELEWPVDMGKWEWPSGGDGKTD